MSRRRMLAPLACCALMAAAARAQDTQSVTLVDGTVVTGEVVEYVAGDHVTVKLANGDTPYSRSRSSAGRSSPRRGDHSRGPL